MLVAGEEQDPALASHTTRSATIRTALVCSVYSEARTTRTALSGFRSCTQQSPPHSLPQAMMYMQLLLLNLHVPSNGLSIPASYPSISLARAPIHVPSAFPSSASLPQQASPPGRKYETIGAACPRGRTNASSTDGAATDIVNGRPESILRSTHNKCNRYVPPTGAMRAID